MEPGGTEGRAQSVLVSAESGPLCGPCSGPEGGGGGSVPALGQRGHGRAGGTEGPLAPPDSPCALPVCPPVLPGVGVQIKLCQTGPCWALLCHNRQQDWAGLGCAMLSQAMPSYAMLDHAVPDLTVPCRAGLYWAVLPQAIHSVMSCGNQDRPGREHTKLPTPCPAVPAPGLAMLGCTITGRLCLPQAITCVPELLCWAVSSQKGCARPGLSHAVLCRPMLCCPMLCHAVP